MLGALKNVQIVHFNSVGFALFDRRHRKCQVAAAFLSSPQRYIKGDRIRLRRLFMDIYKPLTVNWQGNKSPPILLDSSSQLRFGQAPCSAIRCDRRIPSRHQILYQAPNLTHQFHVHSAASYRLPGILVGVDGVTPIDLK